MKPMGTFAEFVSTGNKLGLLRQKHKVQYSSSGAFIGSNHVLTAAHAIGHKEKAKILYKGKVLKAKEVVRLDELDVLLLEVDSGSQMTFPHLEIGGGKQVKLGEKVYGVGFPLGASRNFSPLFYCADVTSVTVEGSPHLFQFNGQSSEGASGTVLVDSRCQIAGVLNSRLVYSHGEEVPSDWNFATKVGSFLSLVQDYLPPTKPREKPARFEATDLARRLETCSVCVLACQK